MKPGIALVHCTLNNIASNRAMHILTLYTFVARLSINMLPTLPPIYYIDITLTQVPSASVSAAQAWNLVFLAFKAVVECELGEWLY
jgi:hypothetical protein